MKNTCWKLFSYLSIDKEAAQDMLSGMANRGWELDKLFPGRVARFRRTEREDLRYFLDWTDPKNEEDLDYLQLCEDAGWDFLRRVGYWNLYVSRPGTSPSPIQTDPETEYERFRGKALRRMAIGGGILLAVLGFYTLTLTAALTRPWVHWDSGLFTQLFYLESISAPLLLLTLPLLLVYEAAYLLRMVGWLWGWKKALEAGKMPPRPRAPEVWKVLSALVSLYGILLWLLLAADCLLNDFGTWGTPVGILLGGFLVWSTTSDRDRRQQGLLYMGMGFLVLLAMAFHDPFRSVFPGRLPPAPLVEGRYIEAQDRTDGLWGSSADWFERRTPEDSYQVSARTWATHALAEEAVERNIRGKDLVPVEGREGVWYGERKNIYLLFRENSYLVIFDSGEEPETLLDTALAWMDRIE